MAYIHVVEPRIAGSQDDDPVHSSDSNDTLREIWAPRPFICAGGFTTPEKVLQTVEEKDGLVAMGRYYISNVSSSQTFASSEWT